MCRREDWWNGGIIGLDSEGRMMASCCQLIVFIKCLGFINMSVLLGAGRWNFIIPYG
jgi:hypothetical protein